MSKFADSLKLDRALMALQKGDRDAIKVIYDVIGRQILALSDAILRDRSSAEDVLQETVIKIIEGIETYRSGGNAKAWILTIARNTALDMKKRRSHAAMLDIEEYANLDAEGFSYSPEDIGRRLMLEDALLTLDTVSRQIVILRAVSGLKHAQIGKVLELSADAVRKRYRRALKRLAEIVEIE